MKILDGIIQGSEQWHAIRARHFCASEAPAMMGVSKYMSRDELLKQKALGKLDEVDGATQERFDAGKSSEAGARLRVENILCVELFPLVGTAEIDGLPLLASYDGVTMDESLVWEHKLENADLVRVIESCSDLDPHYWSQLEHQLLVSNAANVYLTCADSEGNDPIGMYYKSIPARRERIIAGWKQFAADLAAYHPEPEVIKPTATPIKDLPTPTIRVDGSLALISNLDVFGAQLKEFIDNINRTPEDDQEFADAEVAVKTLKKAEDALTAAESTALSQTAGIDEMRRTVSYLRDVARTCRLDMEKIVKAQKVKVKDNAVNDARIQINSHLTVLNKSLGGNYLNDHVADFLSVIHGKKTLTSIKSALNDEVARAKITANETAEVIRANLKTLEEAAQYRFLFNDLNTIVMKTPEDFILLVDSRVNAHKKREEERLEAERERIRVQEEKKARDKLAAEQATRDRELQEEEKKALAQQMTKKKPQTAANVEHPKTQQEAHIEFQHPSPLVQSAQSRPTDAQIIEVLTLHYRVHESKVIEWLLDMDLDAESEKLLTMM